MTPAARPRDPTLAQAPDLAPAPALDDTDRALVRATQGGLPLCPEPYRAVAETLGIETREVLDRLGRMIEGGALRRIGAVVNHYALGYRANGMSVWDVDDGLIDGLGAHVGRLPFVSHCYRRPRRVPVWRYNLFAMVHGKSRDEVAAKVAEIAALLGDASRAHEVLYSSRILKKTGLRFAPVTEEREKPCSV